jgi:ubiquitin C-terminal hydrolase
MSKIDQPKIPINLAQAFVPNGIKVKLTKVSERDDAEVPNNIPVNDYRIGYVRESLLKPIIGMRYGLESVIEKNGKSLHPGHYFITSEVVDTWTENQATIIKTLNSIYKLEVL